MSQHIKMYIHNKKMYMNLTTSSETLIKIGGSRCATKKKIKNNKIIKKPITTHMLTIGAFMKFSDVKLNDLIKNIKIKKIGSFDVKSKDVIGDTDYEKLKLRPGKYTGYTIADSLMIINDDLNITPDATSVGKWTWKHSGTPNPKSEGFGIWASLISGI
jgi:hypothetical protein